MPFERLLQDLRYAARRLWRSPAFTIPTILILAIGIGATASVFSLVHAVLLRPLPFPEPNRLVWISQQDHSLPGVAPESESYPDYFDWRAQNHTLAGLASYLGSTLTVKIHGEAQRLDAETVSGNFFDVLGVHPILGRDFRLDDEARGRHVAMLSNSLWQSQFGSDVNIIGETIVIDGHDYTVAGVMPKGFEFPYENPAPLLWTTLADDATGKTPATQQRGFDELQLVGRLKPGVTAEQAKADLSVIAAHLARTYPDTNKQYTSALVEPELRHMVGDTRPALRVLFGAVCLVLLLVCANVAGLLLARGSRRTAEFALRAAIGASRAAILRQLLFESLLLSLCGGGAGAALAFGLIRVLLNLMPLDIPRMQAASLDGGVLVFVLIVSLVTGVLFGAFPAWRLSRSAPARALGEGARTVSGGRAQHRLHNGLVIAQTVICMVLLVGSGLLLRSFLRILDVNPGFDARQLLTCRVGVAFDQMDNAQFYLLYQQMLAGIAALPGVQSASAGWPLPMSDHSASISFGIQGRPVARGDEPNEPIGVVMPGYFRTMRIPLLAGRAFGEEDGPKGPPTVIVNQAFADKYFPDVNPIGQHMQPGLGDGVFIHPMREVVGVVGNFRGKALTADAAPLYYVPFAQAVITNPYLVVRTSGDPLALQSAIRSVVHRLDPAAPVYEVAPMEDYLSKSAAQPRFQAALLTGFALIALILAAIGLYGLLSYLVVQHTLEIGLRMALGAQKSDVLGMIVRRGLLLTLTGVGSGLGISAMLTRLMAAMLFHVRSADPLTFAGTALLLCIVGAAASCIPAWRAASLDPIKALHQQ